MKSVILICVLLGTTLSSEENRSAAVLEKESDLISAGNKLQFIEDPDGRLTIDDILNSENQNRFTVNSNEVFSRRPTSSAFWLKLKAENRTGKDAWLELGNTFLWTIDFYTEKNGRHILALQTGSLRPESNKAYPVNLFRLPLGNSPGIRTYYIRIHTERPMAVPVRLGTQFSLSENKFRQDSLIAGFVGFMAALFLYSLFLFLSIKERLYFIHLTYLITVFPVLMYINNYPILHYIFNEKISNFLNTRPFFWVCLPFITNGIFAIQFLNLNANPSLKRTVIAVNILSMGLLGIADFFEVIPHFRLTRIAQFVLLFGLFYLAGISLYKWKTDRSRNAAIYFSAWASISISLIIYFLTINGIIKYTDAGRNAVLFGTLMESLLFSFALGYRISRLQKENLQLSENQNHILESAISARTEELKNTQVLLKLSTDNLKAILDNTHQSFTLIDPDFSIREFNRTAEFFSEIIFERKIFKGGSMLNFVLPQHLDEFKSDFKETLSGKTVIKERSFPDSQGRIFHFSFTFNPVYSETGEVTGICFNAADITERRKLEEELKTNEEQLRTLGNNLPNGAIYQVLHRPDKTVSFSYISAGIERMFGVSPKKILENAFNLYRLIHPEDRDRIIESENASAEKLFPFEEVFRQFTEEGELKWVFCRSMPRQTAEGILWDGTVTDITELKNIQNRLEEAIKLAENANRAKSEFLSNMSHEIRTPMNAILGFSDILETQLENEEHRKFLQTIQSSGRTLLSLINDILDLSKIEAGKMEIRAEPCSLRKICRDLENIFKLKTDEKKLFFEIKISEDIPESLLLDEVRIRQILFNLIGNAVKFTSEGSIIIMVECENKSESSLNLHITVKDTGIGIPAEEQTAVFDAFRQTENLNTKKYGGTGLGLAITSQLVALMNGSLSLESEEGKGSVFHILVPNVQICAVETENDSSIKRRGKVLFAESTVLVTDDVESNRKLLREYFRGTEIKVIEAENGFEAVALLNRNPDLILMDIQMPGMDGYETVRKIRFSDSSQKRVPVIALTAFALKQEEEKILSEGFDGYLVKPIRKDTLFNEMSKFLKHEFIQTDDIIYHTTDDSPPIKKGTDEIKILIVDDIMPNRSLVKALCRKKSIQKIYEAENGSDAVLKTIEFEPDLIFMDIKMPVMTGTEAVEIIRSFSSKMGNVPVIALTASSDMREEEFREKGFSGFLNKPVSPNDISTVLQKWLNIE